MRHMAEMLRHAIDAQVSGKAQTRRSIAADAGSVTAVARRESG